MATTTDRAASARVTGYESDISFYATRYKQGGRTIYALNLSPVQVISTITRPDPAQATPGNRAIKLAHAQSFAKYFREHSDWVVPGMILRTSTPFTFEPTENVGGVEFGILSLPRQAAADIHILDGQHRILGFYIAAEMIAQDLDKANNQLVAARRVDPTGAAVKEAQKRIDELKAQRNRLEKERVDLTIAIEPDPARYKQMFFDIADNAKGITGSVKARFDTRKVVNRSMEAVLAHPLLLNRVDIEADRIGRGSVYLMGAKHVSEIIKSVYVGLEGRVSRRQDAEAKESDVAGRATAFLDMLSRTFPQMQSVALGQLLPDTLRQTSLLGSILMIRVLAGVYHDLKQHHFTGEMIQEFFAKLAPHMSAPVYPASIWMRHTEGIFDDGARAPHSRRQDLRALKDILVGWAIDKPAFLYEEPAPRPADSPVGGNGEDYPAEDTTLFDDVTEEEADEILRPEITRARRAAKSRA